MTLDYVIIVFINISSYRHLLKNSQFNAVVNLLNKSDVDRNELYRFRQ